MGAFPQRPDSAPLSPPATPIRPPSQRLQYRAIGLVWGRYTPSEDCLYRGVLTTREGTQLKAVMLGRLISLAKNHLQLSEPHLWVVYPRMTGRAPHLTLNLQMCGVWEPENLQPGATSPPGSLADGYFSIRGETVSPAGRGRATIKIQQAARNNSGQGKSFKLTLQGNLDASVPGCFWDIEAHRRGEQLVIKSSKPIGVLPPKKKAALPPGPPSRVVPKPVRRAPT